MSNRKHRIKVSKISYADDKVRGQVVDSFVWTRGVYTIKEIYNLAMFDGFRDLLTLAELMDMVQNTRDGGNCIFDYDKDMAFEIRHWSYRVGKKK